MADPVVVLDNTHLALQPGIPAQVMVKISSTSSIVEGFSLEVLGEPARWATVTPAQVDIYPGTDATAMVMFTPPSGNTAPSGVFGFGVMARSSSDPNSSAVAEGRVEMAAVAGLQAKLVPVNSSGRWRGRHVVQVANWGNAPAALQFTAYDPDELLGFYLRPDRVDLPVGASAIVRVTARARHPFMRGPVKRVPFQVIGEPVESLGGPAPANPYGNPARPVVDGVLNQKPILSKTFVTMLVLLLVAGIAGGAWAYTRPKAAQDPGLGGLGAPEKPQGFSVKAIAPDKLQLGWIPISQIQSYTVQEIDPTNKTGIIGTTPNIDSSQTGTIVGGLAPDTTKCYRLLAIRAGSQSPPSDVACATTPKPVETASPTPSASPSASDSGSGSPSASPTDSTSTSPTTSPTTTSTDVPTSSPTAPVIFPSGSFILVANYWPTATTPLSLAISRATALQSVGLNGQVLLSTDYVDVRIRNQPLAQQTYLIASGPYQDPETAMADCPTLHKLLPKVPVTSSCIVVQLTRP